MQQYYYKITKSRCERVDGVSTVTTSVGWALQTANKLLKFNSATLTHVDLNTGELICSCFQEYASDDLFVAAQYDFWDGESNIDLCDELRALTIGVLDPLVADVTKTVLDLELEKLWMLWIDIHVVSFDEQRGVPT